MFKNEHVNNAIIVALIAFFVGSCLIAVELSTPPVQPCHEAGKSDCANNNNKPGGIKTALLIFGEFIERHEGAITALATIAIAAFTGTLWFATKKMMEGGERQIVVAGDAAKAVKKSADAMIAIERPRVIISKTAIHETIDEELGYPILICQYRYKNFGKSPAIMENYSINLAILPALPEHPECAVHLSSRNILRQDQETTDLLISTSSRDANLVSKIGEGYSVYLFGFFRYRDVFDAVIITGFCERINWVTGEYALAGGTAYNYDKRETPS